MEQMPITPAPRIVLKAIPGIELLKKDFPDLIGDDVLDRIT